MPVKSQAPAVQRGEKYCTRCGVVRLTDEFWGDRSRPDGRRTMCRRCAQGIEDLRYARVKAKRQPAADGCVPGGWSVTVDEYASRLPGQGLDTCGEPREVNGRLVYRLR